MSTLYFHEIQPYHIGWMVEFTIYRSTVINNEVPSQFVVRGKLDGFIKGDTVDETKITLLVAGQKFVIDLTLFITGQKFGIDPAPYSEQFLINLTNPN